MKKAVPKEILFVSLQFLLFVIYFRPLYSLPFQLSPFLKYATLILGLGGLLIILVPILQLNKNLTPFPTPKAGGTLIETGLTNTFATQHIQE